MIRVFFQSEGKMPFKREALNNLVRYGAIEGSTLAIILCGMPSSPLAWDLKWETASMTSLVVTGLKVKLIFIYLFIF